jgi:hypothetical protein
MSEKPYYGFGHKIRREIEGHRASAFEMYDTPLIIDDVGELIFFFESLEPGRQPVARSSRLDGGVRPRDLLNSQISRERG